MNGAQASPHDGYRWAAAVSAAALALAPLDWPYGYYQILRLGVTAIAIWLVVQANTAQRAGWVVIGAILALCFNPIIPVHFERAIWWTLDWLAAVIFLWSAKTLPSQSNY